MHLIQFPDLNLQLNNIQPRLSFKCVSLFATTKAGTSHREHSQLQEPCTLPITHNTPIHSVLTYPASSSVGSYSRSPVERWALIRQIGEINV